ncbi:CaiB/BaiF CoA transferase family protein [Woodsholea maritima]|uniref:CaiB/BaiF CoA transferase family protein n=1 Tax=Woodsholea maritima TaxID=240237 RepID=UPI0003671E0E|nr:CaiB/BaiF CoA-transferase family protein [Woodsholea maritima]
MGPLRGVKVVEFTGLGPPPFCTMALSDMGAEVIRIDRPGAKGGGPAEILARGRRSIALNLKSDAGRELALQLITGSDILIEGFRPGVMERLGLGPDIAHARNPKLIYGRMTGWGQTGPLADRAGHDITYLALTGALHAIGPKEHSVPPLNLVGDFGGGAMYLAFGVMAALYHAQKTGEGQVVDAAIVDGVTHLLSAQHQLQALGVWTDQREDNWLDGGAPFYRTYRCADDKEIAIGPLEPEFYALLLAGLGLSDHPDMQTPYDKVRWPGMITVFEALFKTRTRDAWAAQFAEGDACLAPVLTLEESAAHPHMVARGVKTDIDGVAQSAPAPRFSKTPGQVQGRAPRPGEHSDAILSELGLSALQIADLIKTGVVG